MVSDSLLMASQRLVFLPSSSRIKGYSFWECFVFLLNGSVFLIIGLELPEIVNGIKSDGIPLKTAIWYGVLITIILILAKIISSYIAMFATIIFRPQIAHNMQKTGRSWWAPIVLGWTGMRGVVSLAAALAIPLTINVYPFPHRHLILFITFVAILLTLVVQGLTLPYIIKKLSPFRGLENALEHENQNRLDMKKGLKQHVFNHMKTKYADDEKWQNHLGMQRVLKHWEDQVNTQDIRWIDENVKTVLLEMFEIQRQYLHDLNQDPSIDEELIRAQIYQIDLEEERIRYV